MGAVAITLALAVAILAIWGDTVVSTVANKILTHASAPADREMPPLAQMRAYSSADVQVLGGQGDPLSCSIPSPVRATIFRKVAEEGPVSLQMRQACVFHDYCYRHGAATYGYSQADCDYMLLEQSYRLCKYISKFSNAPSSTHDCITTARKVLIGVRFGGSDSFKRADLQPAEKSVWDRHCPVAKGLLDDWCTSTYFEFDPYPVRSQAYRIYRLADPPGHWASALAPRKALYVFRARPGGMTLTVAQPGEQDGAGGAARACTGYVLPGSPNVVASAPLVIRTRTAAGGSEDWFVWWRRHDLNSTGGSLAILAPGRATLADWQRVFPGATTFKLTGCAVSEPGAAEAAGRPASHQIWIGKGRSRDDPNFSEIQSALEGEGDAIRLMALRTHSCDRDHTPSTVLCFFDMAIDPSGKEEQPQEPFIVRDGENGFDQDPTSGAKMLEAHPYRNYSSAPVVLSGGERPILAWLRRGKTDDDYATTAWLRTSRRSSRNPGRSESAGIFRLQGLGEDSEPLAVLNRGGDHPNLLSIRRPDGVPRDRSATGVLWSLPIRPGGDERSVDQHPWTCGAFHGTWLIRPPVALSSGKQQLIVFTRYRAEGAPSLVTPPHRIWVDLMAMRFEGAEACALAGTATLDLGDYAPPERDEAVETPEEWTAQAMARLRSRPLLFELQPNGALSVVVPDPYRAAHATRLLVSLLR